MLVLVCAYCSACVDLCDSGPESSIFGHFARLDPGVPANTALHLMTNNHEGRKSSADWIRPPGRPRRTWLNLVHEDANVITLSTL